LKAVCYHSIRPPLFHSWSVWL